MDLTDIDSMEILHPESRRLFRYWEALRCERGAPNRSELDLKQIKSMVSRLFILERHPLRQSFKWRLAGTSICSLWRRELTGQEFGDDWPPFERASLSRLFDTVVTQLQPGVARLEIHSMHGDRLGVELLCVPIRQDGTNTVQVLGGFQLFRDPIWIGRVDVAQIKLSRMRIIWTENALETGGDMVVQPNRPASQGATVLRVIHGGLAD